MQSPRQAGRNLGQTRFSRLMLFMVTVALVGAGLMVGSRAATPTASVEAETGSLQNGSVSEVDSSASGGSAVRFVASSGGNPSGVAMPSGDVTSGGHTWHQVIAEDFTVDAPLGSWDDSGTLTACPANADAVEYTGASGAQWTSYPKCYLNTDHTHHYRSDQTLSVHGGQLDYWLHSVGGVPTSANPGPIFPGGSRNQTYGRFEVRFKTTTQSLSEFYVAWLLWPSDDAKWTCAESDFPESNLGNTAVNAYAHYNTDTINCPDSSRHQDAYSSVIDFTQWHTYTQEWLPGRRNYYLDGVLLGSSTNNVYSGPERWQLQTEVTSSCDSGATNTCSQDGHLLLDWAVAYSY